MKIFGKIVVVLLTIGIIAVGLFAKVQIEDKDKVNVDLALKELAEKESELKIEELNAQIKTLEDALVSADKNAELKDSEKTELDTQMNELKKQIEELGVQIAELNKQKESMSQQITDLENRPPEIVYVETLPKIDPSFEYQTKYPDLYAQPAEKLTSPQSKTLYLTFDDGPSNRTDEVLAVLEKYNIKATFFVAPNGSDESNARLKKIADAGHTIGIHTSSHVYNKIYASVDAFLDDFYKAYKTVENATGVKAEIFRFPGGSINSYNKAIYQPLIAEMLRRGFMYYDWNASGDDSAGQTTAQGIADRAIATTGSQKKAILLLHDNELKYATVEALPLIIEALQAKGYVFAPITNGLMPAVFPYKDQDIK